jgi:hypothetical protein
MFLLFSLSSFAGFTKGNGGNILSCTDSKSRVLDYFELTQLHQFQFALELTNNSTFFENIELRMQILDKISPNLSLGFKALKEQLLNTIIFVDAEKLGEIDDVFAVIIPNNCQIHQAVIQRNKRIIVSQPLFNDLSFDQQNILILHEIIYAYFLDQKKLNDSRPVRAFVALLLSQELINLTQYQLTKFLDNNNILPYL